MRTASPAFVLSLALITSLACGRDPIAIDGEDDVAAESSTGTSDTGTSTSDTGTSTGTSTSDTDRKSVV